MADEITGTAPIKLFDNAEAGASFLQWQDNRIQPIDAGEVLAWCNERDIAMDLTTSRHGGPKLYRIGPKPNQMFEFKMRWRA
jgi:hypothetical protein